jgi:hypothetical protein
VINGDKFATNGSLAVGHSWHCGSAEQIQAAKLFRKVQRKLYEFGLGHLCPRAFKYGLVSLPEVVRLYKLQKSECDYDEAQWEARYSRDGESLFSNRGGFYYDMPQMDKMVKSLRRIQREQLPFP